MRSKMITVARALYGITFFGFGLNGLFHFVPDPPSAPAGDAFLTGLASAGYFFPLLAATQALAGLALLVNRFVPLALVVLAPIVVHIAAFHLFLSPGLLEVVGLLALEIGLAWAYRPAFRDLLKPRDERIAV